MGFWDFLFVCSSLNSARKRRGLNAGNNGYSNYNRGYSDGYYSAYSDRSFDNDCDCGYCSDHDYYCEDNHYDHYDDYDDDNGDW